MPLFSKESKLKDVIFHDMTVIPLLNRFGIHLGVGDFTIEEICKKHDVESSLFLMILNTYLKDDYIPEINKGRSEIRMIIEFLRKTNQYYSKSLLVTIESHFRMLVVRNKGLNNNLDFLWKFFQELKSEMISRIDTDEKIWFPTLERILDGSDISEIQLNLYENIPSDERVIEDKINDLVSFFVIHLMGEYDPDLCMGVITSVFTLDKEIKKNNRIRQKILRPLTRSVIEFKKKS